MIKRDEILNPNSCWNKAGDAEVMFIMLERDPAVPEAIRAWVEARIRLGKNERTDPQIVEALILACTMEARHG